MTIGDGREPEKGTADLVLVLDRETVTKTTSINLKRRDDKGEEGETDAGFHSEGGEGAVASGPGGLVVRDSETSHRACEGRERVNG